MTMPLSEAVEVLAFGRISVAGCPVKTRALVLPATNGLLTVLKLTAHQSRVSSRPRPGCRRIRRRPRERRARRRNACPGKTAEELLVWPSWAAPYAESSGSQWSAVDDEVGDPRDRVRAIGDGGATGRRLRALQQRSGDEVEVHRVGGGERSTLHRGGRDAPAINRSQGCGWRRDRASGQSRHEVLDEVAVVAGVLWGRKAGIWFGIWEMLAAPWRATCSAWHHVTGVGVVTRNARCASR